MRKWLVGLLAAGLCLSSAWADTVTYTVTSKTAVEVSGTAPEGSSAEYAADSTQVAQISSNKTATLTLKGFAGTTITGLTLSMKSNSKAGSGSLSVTCGDAIIASIEDSAFKDGWSDAYTTAYVDVTPGLTATAVADNEDVVITINGSVNSLYCQSYTIEYTAGDPVFSVKFDKENWFKVAQGQASSVTAIPQYGIEPYTFLWESDTPELNGGTTDTLEIPATLAEGDYTVACLVTEDNGEGDAINALIGFTVEAIPVITGDNFELVSSSDELQDGMRVLVTDVSHAFAMSSVATGSALASVDVTETDGVITASDESIIWTLVEDSDGNFALQNGEQYVGWPSGNAAKMQADSFANKISVAEGVATITAASDTTRNLKYNKSSPRFAYYTSAQTDLALFKEAGEAGLSVTLDKANGFTVDLGTADSITATAKNGVEPYTYAWTSDTPDLNGTGETLAIPATLAEGDYTVQVEVTDAEANKANKQIYFSVVAPLEPHAINIDVGIQNGTVTSDPEGEAVKGTQVKLTATATTEGYALKEMTVTYGETVLTFTASPATFEMPDEAVSVGAIFAEVKDYAELPFVAEDTPYSGPWKGATVDGLTSKGLGTDYGDGSAKLDSTGDWLQVKFAGTPGTLSYGIKGNSVSADNPSTFLVQESADGETWSTLATYVSGDNLGDKAEASHELSASSQFVRFFYETKGAGNVGIYDVYISSGGPAVFSVTLDPAKDFEVEQNAEAFVTAIPKHAAEGVVGYAWWIDGTPVDTAGEVLALATAELGPHKVTCEATDAAGAKADAHVIYTVVAPAVKYAVNVAIGILNGTVTTDVSEAAEGDPVTVTATPADGYRLVEIIVNNGEVAVSGNTFVMPAQDVLVTATFEEFEVPPYYFQFETGKPAANSYKDTDADVVNTGSTSDTVPTVNFTLQRAGRGGDEKDKFVGTYALRMGPTNEVPAFFYNTEAFSEDITAISFQYGIYGTDKCESFTVSTSADGADWTQLADLTADASADGLKTYTNDELPAGVRFIRFDATSTQKSNIRRINIDEIQLWTGAPRPKIVYSGETTIALGGKFEIIFGLLNYDGDFQWEVASREGGTIVPEGRDGLYTWTPTEVTGDEGVTIKVVARSGELDIATKEVVLTVTEPGPQPGEPAIVFGGDKDGVVGTPVNFTVEAVNMANTDIYGGWTEHEGLFDAPEGSALSDAGVTQDFPNVSFTPDVAGQYVFYFNAGEGDEYREGSWTVTVTGEGPGPQPSDAAITKMTIASGKMTIEFTGTAPQVLLSDDMQTWTAVDGAISPFEFNMDEADKKYIGVR